MLSSLPASKGPVEGDHSPHEEERGVRAPKKVTPPPVGLFRLPIAARWEELMRRRRALAASGGAHGAQGRAAPKAVQRQRRQPVAAAEALRRRRGPPAALFRTARRPSPGLRGRRPLPLPRPCAARSSQGPPASGRRRAGRILSRRPHRPAGRWCTGQERPPGTVAVENYGAGRLARDKRARAASVR